jgi:hypothetical protein
VSHGIERITQISYCTWPHLNMLVLLRRSENLERIRNDVNYKSQSVCAERVLIMYVLNVGHENRSK